MLQKLDPLALLADLPESRALLKAREALEVRRQEAEAAVVVARVHYARCAKADRWIRSDHEASKAESEVTRTAVAFRVAAAEVEKQRRAHGETSLSKHFAKHTDPAVAALLDALEAAHRLARGIADVAARADRDGANVPLSIRKSQRIANELRAMCGRFQ